MDAKYRGRKVEGVDDNWKSMKVNPAYNTSGIIKAVGDIFKSKTEKRKK